MLLLVSETPYIAERDRSAGRQPPAMQFEKPKPIPGRATGPSAGTRRTDRKAENQGKYPAKQLKPIGTTGQWKMALIVQFCERHRSPKPKLARGASVAIMPDRARAALFAALLCLPLI